jgi:alpha-tubulin suppressor-like RCC1 family protein
MPFVNTLRSSTSVSFGKKRSAAEALLGNLLAWGAGTRTDIFDTGNLGDGFSVDRSSPVHVGALRTWLTPSAMYQQAMCTKSDGTLWAWGRNSGYGAGCLGLGDTVDRSSPVQIGALTTWLTPCMGYGHAMCIKTDGTLWLWGLNSGGELGFNDTVNRSSPVQLGGLTTWSQPASSGNYTFCQRTDNTLWVWGGNSSGQLGLNDTNARSSPTQLGGAEWSKTVGNRSGGLAVKTGGTVWTWGSYPRSFGPPKDTSSPVQLGSNSNWNTPASARYAQFCTTTGGQLWALGGQSDFGQL